MPIFLSAAPATLPFASPTLADALTRLRQDIFDQAGASPRWADSDLTRAIDRALDEYSIVQPFLQAVYVAAVQNSRIYPVPTNPLGTGWWIDSWSSPPTCGRATISPSAS